MRLDDLMPLAARHHALPAIVWAWGVLEIAQDAWDRPWIAAAEAVAHGAFGVALWVNDNALLRSRGTARGGRR